MHGTTRKSKICFSFPVLAGAIILEQVTSVLCMIWKYSALSIRVQCTHGVHHPLGLVEINFSTFWYALLVF